MRSCAQLLIVAALLSLLAACEPEWDTELTGRLEYVMPLGPRLVHNEGRTALFFDDDVEFVNIHVDGRNVTWDFDAIYVVRGIDTLPEAEPDGTFLVAAGTSAWLDVTYIEKLGPERSGELRDQIRPPQDEVAGPAAASDYEAPVEEAAGDEPTRSGDE